MRGTRLYLVTHKGSYNCKYIVHASNKEEARDNVYNDFVGGKAREYGVAKTDFSVVKLDLQEGEILRV